MARSKHADTRYLELKNGKYRVTVAVPRALQGTLGAKLKRPLNTDSRATANTLKWAVVAELKAIIDREGRGVPQGDHLTREALELATHRVTVRDDQELAQLDEEIGGGLTRCLVTRWRPRRTRTPATLCTSMTQGERARRACSLQWPQGGPRRSSTTTGTSSPSPSPRLARSPTSAGPSPSSPRGATRPAPPRPLRPSPARRPSGSTTRSLSSPARQQAL